MMEVTTQFESGFMNKIKGFTLVEVVVVAAIMAILAAVAVPTYRAYVKNARLDAAKSACEVIAAAVKHQHVRGVDISCGECTGADFEGYLGITDPSDDKWQYSFPGIASASPIPADYAVTATSLVGDGTWNLFPKQSGANRWQEG